MSNFQAFQLWYKIELYMYTNLKTCKAVAPKTRSLEKSFSIILRMEVLFLMKEKTLFITKKF